MDIGSLLEGCYYHLREVFELAEDHFFVVRVDLLVQAGVDHVVGDLAEVGFEGGQFLGEGARDV